MDISEEQYCCNSETDEYESDESQDDPTFDAMEETRLNLLTLSVHRKTKTRVVNGADKRNEQETNGTDMTDEQDFKSYDTIQMIIRGGTVETLKVDQCKVYLRKHGLRLSGNKDTLIQRIKEHNDILSAGAEEKYPASSFVLNCKGDACTGDVVMFEQNVYEMFNIASRSANGPPCGTRVIAGRVVKESYGASKQQHTFTIEVLWSKGEKPFPPLHPLLIKGRNLYRLKTMRQKWDDEEEREKILAEKHSRGGTARVNREARMQTKRMGMMPVQKRGRRDEDPLRPKPVEKRKTLCPVSTRPEKVFNPPNQKQKDCVQKVCCQDVTDAPDIPNHSGNFMEKPKSILGAYVPAEQLYQRQPLMSVNSSNFPRGPHTISTSNFTKSSNLRTPAEMMASTENNGFNSIRSSMRGFGNYYSLQCTGYRGQENYIADRNASIQEAGYGRKQTCRYYPQGMCHFGDRCRFLHE